MRIGRSVYDTITDVLSIVMLLGVAFFLWQSWDTIPAEVPMHYSMAGQADRLSAKTTLLFLPILAAVLFVGLTVLEHFPRLWNTGVAVTEENCWRVYRTMKDLLGTTKLLMVAIFTYLTVQSARGGDLPVWLLPVFLVLLFGHIVFFFVKLRKIR